jgi:anti-sigma factor RsiW
MILPGNVDACARVLALLDAWVDGELDTDEAALVERHKAACARCRAEAILVRAVARSVRQMPQPEPSPSVRSRLLARALEESTIRRVQIEHTEGVSSRVVFRYETGSAPAPLQTPSASTLAGPPGGRWILCQQQVRTVGGSLYQVVETTEWR